MPTKKTKIVHYKKEKFDVYIGRPSIFGNPFIIGKDGNRQEVLYKYKKWVVTQPELLEKIYKLEGKVLGCWCKPKKCHGDVIIKLIDKHKNELMIGEL